MPKNRIFPALAVAFVLPLLAWGQAPAPGPALGTPGPAATPAPPPTEAEKLIDAAIAKLKGLKSVSARIAENVEILGQKFSLEGLYMKAPNYCTYMSLKLAGLSDVAGTMLQVCDGKTLWDFQNVLQASNCRKLEIDKIVQKLQSPDCTAEVRERAFAQFGFSGPDVLLSGLRKEVEFNQKDEGTFEGQAVWILRGTWKDRENISAPGQPKVAPTGPLPPYVPSLVTIYLGKEDGWPYQVKLEGKALSILIPKKDDRPRGPDGRPIGRPLAVKNEEPSKVLLTFSEVVMNAELGPEKFAFEPPSNIRVEDGTEQLVAGLDAMISNEALRKKQKAAQESGGAELPQVAAPKPATDAPAVAPK
jgi:hypothetical protein